MKWTLVRHLENRNGNDISFFVEDDIIKYKDGDDIVNVVVNGGVEIIGFTNDGILVERFYPPVDVPAHDWYNQSLELLKSR